mmetsp:Transcript_135926/g.235753  ORF Transcript_135926/g.235753 Transcript_135926/m.235753 type:complete len:81 (-) Transcript_135926:654-896(-)
MQYFEAHLKKNGEPMHAHRNFFALLVGAMCRTHKDYLRCPAVSCPGKCQSITVSQLPVGLATTGMAVTVSDKASPVTQQG